MTSPPQGTVTFLFTDIQGSTRMWEEQPDQMRIALERHDALLRAIVEEHDGFVFKTVGDAFCVAFGEAGNAAAAATAVQRALSEERWPDGIAIAVRMGLHSGAASFRDNDYFGPAVNRVARIEAAGHGGQILLSQATANLLADDLPAGGSLREMGVHRLKDLANPEELFQLQVAGLPDNFPVLRTLTAQRTNLPADLEPIVGRERALLEVQTLVERDDVRLVTLSGAGGTGKTRLSLAVGKALLENVPDGVFFVQLETVRDPNAVLPMIAAAVGVPVDPSREIIQSLADALGRKEMVLILDNMEQVVSAADRLGALLRECPRLTVLASSRQLLSVAGEHEYPVLPLGLPERGSRLSPAVAVQYEAVSLFRDRARRVRPDFELDDGNVEDVVGICRELEGMPLAIELAVARIRLLSPARIRERLHDSLGLLASRRRDVTARQATMRGAIDWSYELLDAVEKQVFCRLATFSGGWSYEAAEAVLAGLDVDPLEALESLREKSLIREVESARGGDRFAMLHLLAEYGREKLAESPDETQALRLYARFFEQLAKRVSQEEVALIGVTLIDDRANFIRAIEWSLAAGEHELALSLMQALFQPFLSDVATLKRMREWSQSIVEGGRLSPPGLADAVRLHGIMHYYASEYPDAEQAFVRARELSLEAGDQDGAIASMNNLAVLKGTGDHDPIEVIELHEEVMQLAEQTGKAEPLGRACANLANEYRRVGDPQTALRMAERAAEVMPGHLPPSHWVRRLKIEALIDLDRADEAKAFYGPGVRAWWDLTQDITALIGYTTVAGKLALAVGNPQDAALFLGIIHGMADRGAVISSEQVIVEELDSLARRELHGDEFDRAFAVGAALSEQQAIDRILNA